MANEPNLYESLFADSTDTDCELEMISQMFQHLNFKELSNYFDISSYNNSLPNIDTQMLNILHLNLRSMRANVDKMTAFLQSLKHPPDIVAISEHWLNESNKDSFNLNGYQSFHTIRTWGLHGGASILVRNNINAELISEYSFSNRDIEICTVTIKLGNQKFNIVAIYRPRSKHVRVDKFTEIFSDILKNNFFAKSNTILIGDFNINLLEHQTHQETGNYLATMQSLNFIPVISRPTRYPEGNQNGCQSLLDHIYVNFTLPSLSGIIKYDITDHLPVFLNVLLPQPHQNLNYKVKFRIFNDANRSLFTRNLSYIDWEQLLSADENVNINFDRFYDTLRNIYNQCFPVTTKIISTRRIQNPWITAGLLTSIRHKSTLYKDYKDGLIMELQYKSYNNRVNALVRKCKRDYYRNIFANFKNNTRKLWKTINNLTKPPSPKQNFNSIIADNKIITKANDISNAFNKFFTSIATKLESALPTPQNDPIDYLQGEFPNNMIKPRISYIDIFREIKTLKNKSCDINDFSAQIIKDNAQNLAFPLAFIYNQSLDQSSFPNRLKAARVTPLYKKGAKTDMNNYRPISILNIFSKIFEKIMKWYLVRFMVENNILSPNQYGFQKGRSTQDALIAFSKKLYTELDKSNSVLSIFIDFSKAFDTVPHDLLIKKMEFYGIRGALNDWFKDYLSNRSQKTSIDGYLSNTDSISLGVPQGSVLGPILFLLFINDLPNISKLFYTILFADDATLTLVGSNQYDLITLANAELDKFYHWCISNRLSVNILKTTYIMFGNSHVNNPPPLLMKSNYTYEIIKRTTETKFLGIYYDQKLSFKAHINHLTQKLSRTCGLIYRVKDIMPTYVLKNMYHAHVGSIINYCNIIWSNICPSNLKPLTLIMKRIIRNITKSEFLAHTEPLFKRMKILDLEGIRKISLATYYYSNQVDNIPPLVATHDYETRHRNRLRPPQHRHTLFHNSFLYQAPSFWNTLTYDYPPNIKNAPNLRIFKNRLKKFILQ